MTTSPTAGVVPELCLGAMVGVVADPVGNTDSSYNLGSYHRAVDTPSAQAQSWFDRGMAWAYAFNHEEAMRCFEEALGLDPDLAIARWGIAYSVGPNYSGRSRCRARGLFRCHRRPRRGPSSRGWTGWRAHSVRFGCGGPAGPRSAMAMGRSLSPHRWRRSPPTESYSSLHPTDVRALPG